MKRRIVLLGPPAAGKGTQAEMIAARYKLSSISTGALMRRERERGTDLGREAEKWTSQGKLFPDELALKAVRQWLAEVGSEKYLFDGFPRTVNQARAFDAGMGENRVEVVFNLALSDDGIRARVQDRITCTHCGATFGGSFDHFAAGDRCPKCGQALERRNDDTLAALKERLEQHRELTEPLLGYYGESDRLVEIDADAPRDEVFARICAEIEEGVPT